MDSSDIRDIDKKSFLAYLNSHKKLVFYKAFNCADYALCFANGNALISRLSAFREAQCPKDGRFDNKDGVRETTGVATISPDGSMAFTAKTDFGSIVLTLSDSKDIQTKDYVFRDVTDCVVFCLSGLFDKDVLLPDELENSINLGRYFVVVEDSFGLISSMIKTGHFIKAGWIIYSDLPPRDTIFTKGTSYSHEHEYRFVFKEDKIPGKQALIPFGEVSCKVFRIVN